ncbi:hypothetical protein E2C01_082791 [Portunus trituberculatus]|uniref:Uncharacterized protein n=1 Tax=Portunus trituberculatus TaxID=210409 RepID=A0A5B7IQV1_PORTR|nr:hypothetical protein [Portunus trituberculatus]
MLSLPCPLGCEGSGSAGQSSGVGSRTLLPQDSFTGGFNNEINRWKKRSLLSLAGRDSDYTANTGK